MPNTKLRFANRRRTLARLAGLAACAATSSTGAPAEVASDAGEAPRSEGPTFDRGGPDAARYAIDDGYPIPPRAQAIAEGNPWSPRYRVGAFSHLDAIYSTRRIARADAPWLFKRSAGDVRYRLQGRQASLSEYVARHPVTGLVVVRDGHILFEHYQYGRTDGDLLLAQSMTKSVTGLLIGTAIADGAIKSIDDTPATYVDGFKGSEFGRTPIRDLLHMASGVDFGEEEDGARDLNRLWRDMVLGAGLFKKGTIDSIKQFNRRSAPPGTRYHYASIEPDVLAVVLRYATRQPLSTYLQDRLWRPIGAEADATWLVDAEGFEVGHFGLSAALRDYARVGRLLACDGAWDGTQIVPARWVVEATSVRSSDQYLAPGHAMQKFGYGYLVWLLAGSRRQFAFVGQNGQRLCVDPQSKLVMVHTALEEIPEVWRVWDALVEQLG